MTTPSIQVNNGFYNTAGYVDFSNPSARGWWFSKIKPLYDAGIAGFWTDLGEPEQDNASRRCTTCTTFCGIRDWRKDLPPTTPMRGSTS